MKTIAILLLSCSTATAQIQKDKALHFGAGLAISATTTAITYKITNNKNTSMLVGFGAATLAGVAKEVYDKKSGKGVPDSKDALWTSIGGGVGMTIRFTFK